MKEQGKARLFAIIRQNEDYFCCVLIEDPMLQSRLIRSDLI